MPSPTYGVRSAAGDPCQPQRVQTAQRLFRDSAPRMNMTNSDYPIRRAVALPGLSIRGFGSEFRPNSASRCLVAEIAVGEALPISSLLPRITLAAELLQDSRSSTLIGRDRIRSQNKRTVECLRIHTALANVNPPTRDEGSGGLDVAGNAARR